MSQGHKPLPPPLQRGAWKAPAREACHTGRRLMAAARRGAKPGRTIPAMTASSLGLGQRGPPILLRQQGRWVAPPALIMPHAVRNSSREGITRAITTVYYRTSRTGNHGPAARSPRPQAERAVTGIVALACFMTGFIVAWLLRTGYVAAQVSWVQEQMERKVRYWQGEAIHARAVAEHLLRQLEALTGRPTEPTDWPEPDTDWSDPDTY